MSRAGTLFPPPSPQLNLETLDSNLLNNIFSFLDPETKYRFALLKSAKKNPVWNNLLHKILAQYFLKLVAWGVPATYELEKITKPQQHEEFKQTDVNALFKPGIFYFKLNPEFLAYRVSNPKGEFISNVINFSELAFLPIKFPEFEELRAVRSIFPYILKITMMRGDTFCMEAEKFLTIYPQLRAILKVKSQVIDRAENKFDNITAYQYAVWAKDTHAWRMLEKFMDADEIKKQRDEMNTPAFKRQQGSYWDSPREYFLNYVIATDLPSPEDLIIPSLVKIQKPPAAPEFYLFGNQYSHGTPITMRPEFTLLDHNKFQFELISIEAKTNQNIQVTSTNQYSKLYEEIDAKQAHLVNPLISAMLTLIRSGKREDELSYAIGRAQRKIPMHIVNEYCCPGSHFTSLDFKTSVLPRFSRLTDGTDWFPLTDNTMACCIYLRSVDEFPVLANLREEKCEVPTLFKIQNNNISYALYGLNPKTREPMISPIILDDFPLGIDGTSIFNQEKYLVDDSSPIFHELIKFQIVFSSLGLNVCITRGDNLNGAVINNNDLQNANIDLMAITALCYERTRDVLEIAPQPTSSYVILRRS